MKHKSTGDGSLCSAFEATLPTAGGHGSASAFRRSKPHVSFPLFLRFGCQCKEPPYNLAVFISSLRRHPDKTKSRLVCSSARSGSVNVYSVCAVGVCSPLLFPSPASRGLRGPGPRGRDFHPCTPDRRSFPPRLTGNARLSMMPPGPVFSLKRSRPSA